MIIGVDAGALSITDNRLKVGVWRITYNVLRELGKIDKKNTYRLYTFLPIDEGTMRVFGSSMKNVILPQKGWFTIWLPFELKRHPVDVYLGLSQSLPSSSARSIGFIYDLGFFHEPGLYPDSYKKLQQITTDTVKKSDHIVTISVFSKQNIQSLFHVDPQKITVCYPGVDTLFRPQGDRYVAKHPYILFVGALKRGKNIPLLIRAFGQFLKTQKTPYDLVLVGGDYWLDPDIKTTMQQLSLNNRVILTGFIDDNTLASYYCGATCFVMPSQWEGFCLPVIEAMASGTPIVVVNRGALPEIARDSGLIANPTVEDLSNAMMQIVARQSLQKKLKRNSLKRAKQFSWRSFAESVLTIIK